MVNTNYISRHTGEQIDDAIDKMNRVNDVFLHIIFISCPKYIVGSTDYNNNINATIYLLSNSEEPTTVSTIKDFGKVSDNKVINSIVTLNAASAQAQAVISPDLTFANLNINILGFNTMENKFNQVRIPYDDIATVNDEVVRYGNHSV